MDVYELIRFLDCTRLKAVDRTWPLGYLKSHTPRGNLSPFHSSFLLTCRKSLTPMFTTRVKEVRSGKDGQYKCIPVHCQTQYDGTSIGFSYLTVLHPLDTIASLNMVPCLVLGGSKRSSAPLRTVPEQERRQAAPEPECCMRRSGMLCSLFTPYTNRAAW